MKAVMNKNNDKWHIGEKMREMAGLRTDALKTMTRNEFRQKEEKNFVAVRDFLNKGDNREAYNRCYSKPWIFYGVYSFEECVKILLEESPMPKRKVGEQNDKL